MCRPDEAPRFEIDPAWPKLVPNKWVLGQAAKERTLQVFVTARLDSLYHHPKNAA
jgi:hypothetical protein